MAFQIIYDKPGEPTMYIGSSAEVAGNDDALNAALPGAAVGTMVTSPGYTTIKQLGPDGSWATL